MQDILRKIPPEKRRTISAVYASILILAISLIMLANSGGEIDTDLIPYFDATIYLIILGSSSVLIFIGIPLLFILVILKIEINEFIPKISWFTATSALLITVCAMVIISPVAEWNMNLDFGDSDFAQWARNSEDQLRMLTAHLTTFTSPVQFVLSLVVIGIIPAVGEELLFRGLIQNNLSIALKNHHTAIWLTGFIFAAIHLQFFGLVPRMLLGVLFGYLYHWSGKLTVAMLAHLINNGLQVVLLYLVQQEAIDISPEEMEQAAPWPALLIFGALGAYLLYNFKQRFNPENE
ncbi:MAG: CPBP family intramembrane metalloprotease [Ekhidna sp.]|nr:CPBP family intramembrane metalloprotease [Ekhidna sp.]MBC6410098.1 CPBP family intramembrane metalloprotease [Ekhidna sp.]MBC6425118.1 CPBP family intramembrane metalloprotease [Ekhidna sp.]